MTPPFLVTKRPFINSFYLFCVNLVIVNFIVYFYAVINLDCAS